MYTFPHESDFMKPGMCWPVATVCLIDQNMYKQKHTLLNACATHYLYALY